MNASDEQNHEAIFDPAQFDVLMELREEGDDSMLREILEQFLADSAAQLQTLETATPAKDLREVAHAAHSMKGGASTFGLMRATSLALQMEMAAKAGQDKDLETLRCLLVEAFSQGRRELEEYASRRLHA